MGYTVLLEDDLDFQIVHRNKDKMGQLCFKFEQMREQLMQNNQILWKKVNMVELG